MSVERRLGNYRVGPLLGQGGMGRVYLATRWDDFERQVVIKIAGQRLSSAAAERARGERRILARLDHPNVARLLDGGTTPDGLPYLVLEHVEGLPLDEHCRVHRLSRARRLDLFRQLCGAVEHAHRNLVVHRDLKSANVLVTRDGVPKLLDFGVAVLLKDDSSPTDDLPSAGATSSPEQRAGTRWTGEPVTTLGDVYSLGVMLRSLFDGPLPRDLEAVAAKATRPRPEERYSSAQRLSDDVGRYLRGLPVHALEGQRAYRGLKLAWYYKWFLGAAASLAVLAVLSTVLWRQAVDERRLAEEKTARADEVSLFLENLFLASPSTAGEVTVHDLLDNGRSEILLRPVSAAATDADLLRILGTVYARLGHYDEAWELKERALQERYRGSAADDPELATEISNLAKALYDKGRYDTAVGAYRASLAMRHRLGQSDDESVRTAFGLAVALAAAGEYAEAETLHREVLATRVRLWGERHRNVASSHYSLGVLNYARSHFAEAEAELREALDVYSRAGENTRLASVLNSLARVLHARVLLGEEGRREDAEDAVLRALALRRKLLGDDHHKTADSKKNLAEILLAGTPSPEEVATAGVLLAQALPVLRASLPADHWTVADAEGVRGLYLLRLGCADEATTSLKRSYRLIRDAKGETSIYTRRARQRLAERTPVVHP